MCFQCLKRCKAFVSTSAVCSGSQQESILIMPLFIASCTLWYQTAMCLAWLWNWGFLAIEIDPLLLPLIVVGDSCLIPNSS